MLRNILKPSAALILLSLVSVPCTAEENIFRKGPYLIYPNDNTKMTVLWQTVKTPKSSFIEWGEQGNPFSNKREITESDSTEHGHQFSYTITGLKPGTRVFYRITADGEKEAGLFRTAPEDTADSLTFYAMGDTNTDLADFDTVMSRVFRDMGTDLSSRQTFILHAGDLVDNGTVEPDWDKQLFTPSKRHITTMLKYLPVMACRGNHEGYKGTTLFPKYLPYNFKEKDTDRFYYSFDYGPVHIACVDPYAGDIPAQAFSKGSRQYTWLEQDLKTAKKRWNIAVCHEPAWSARGGHANNEHVQKYLHPLFKKHNVQLVISGHNHYYARCAVDGIVYITTGGGGTTLRTPDRNQPYLEFALKTHHFLRINIQKDTMKITAVGKDGTIIDTTDIAYEKQENENINPKY